LRQRYKKFTLKGKVTRRARLKSKQKETMSYLVKYCKDEHNILKSCPTLRLGTFQYYREINPSQEIADETDGQERVSVKSYIPKNASKEAKEYFGNNVFISNSTCYANFPNSFMFCTSLNNGENRKNARRIDSSYNSFYYITNPIIFSDKLANLLIGSFKPEWFHLSIKEKRSSTVI
jgi:hypothetical protein